MEGVEELRDAPPHRPECVRDGGDGDAHIALHSQGTQRSCGAVPGGVEGGEEAGGVAFNIASSDISRCAAQEILRIVYVSKGWIWIKSRTNLFVWGRAIEDNDFSNHTRKQSAGKVSLSILLVIGNQYLNDYYLCLYSYCCKENV